MKRKIVRQGKSTMTVSLPAEWIHKYNLNDGDELELQENGNSINITTSTQIGDKSITLDSKKRGKITKNEFNHLYCLGYDEIKIIFNNKESLEDIKKQLTVCPGFEPIDQKEDSITIKNISSSLDSEFDNILRKVFLLITEMAVPIHDALSKKEFKRLSQIKDLESINNKYTNFLKRILAKKGYKEQDRTLPAYDLMQNLERLADEYKYLCEDYENSKKEISKEALNLLKDANEFYRRFYEMAYSFNPDLKQTLFTDKKELTKRAEKLIASNKEPLLALRINNILEKIFFCIGSHLCMVAGK
jgi:phosphate uptake regulator